MDTLLYTPDELADQLRIPRATIDRWRYNHQGPTAIRIGRHVRYRSSDVRAWIDSQPVRQSRGANRVGNQLFRPVSHPTSPARGAQIASGEELGAPLAQYACHACPRNVNSHDDASITALGWVHRDNKWYCTACSYTQ